MVTNEVLAAKQDALVQRLEKMELKLDNYAASFITSEVFELRMREQDLQFKLIEKSVGDRIDNLDKKVSALLGKRWMQNTLSAAFGSVLTTTLGYILYSIFHKGS